MTHSTYRISCKAAIYSPDNTKVLVIRLLYLGEGAFGLPGGHLEDGELPDEAIKRELIEEVGIANTELSRKDFWLHEDGKIILAFTGKASTEKLPDTPNPEREIAEWATLDDVRSGKINIGSYADFVMSNRPKDNT